MHTESVRFARQTRRLDEVAAFYRDALGFAVVTSWDRGPNNRGVILAPPGEIAGFTLELLEDEDAGELSGLCSFGLQVADADAAHDALVARGVAIVKPPRDLPWGHRGLSVADPDGFAIWMFQELGRGA